MIRAAIRLACDITIAIAQAVYDAAADPIDITHTPAHPQAGGYRWREPTPATPHWHAEPL